MDPLTAAYSAGLFANPSIPRYGTVIPNRIFVGGIDFKVRLPSFFRCLNVIPGIHCRPKKKIYKNFFAPLDE